MTTLPARPAVLVIAATDSSGGAGITRDAETLAQFGADGVYAVTAITAQSDCRVAAVHPIPVGMVREQILAAFQTRRIAAVKIGVLGTAAIVEAVSQYLPQAVPVVLDPVLSATSGGLLLESGGMQVLREQLMPRITLLTPNVPEAAALLGEQPASRAAQLQEQARRLLALGPHAVLLKGGHVPGEESSDLLLVNGAPPVTISAPRLNARRRGTGCALATAVAAGLASGMALTEACRRAKQYVLELLRQSQTLTSGLRPE